MTQSVRSSFVIAGIGVLACFGCTASVGDHDVSAEAKIVGGTVAADGAWAGAAVVYRDLGPDGMWQTCGATLVAPKWVVTAAHCVPIPRYPNGGIDHVVVGRNKLSAAGGETIRVTRAYQHQAFNATTYLNDIAVLELETPSTSPVAKLVAPAQALAAVVPAAMSTVVGWGATTEDGEKSDDLLEVDVPIIDNATCKAFPHYENVSDGMLCAGYVDGGKDSCQGDSGGALFMKIDGEIVHVGITSWGLGCARASAPGVYTRTATYLGWLWTATGGAVGIAP